MIGLDQLVSPWAKSTPKQIAVDGDEALTYEQLDLLANRFANLLLASGLHPGDRVGIHLTRSGRAIAAMLGVLRAGGAYVPLDPSSPPTRMQLVVSDCGLRHVVIAPHLLKGWMAAGVCKTVEHFRLTEEMSQSEGPKAGRIISGPRSANLMVRVQNHPVGVTTTWRISSTLRAQPACRRE